MDGAVHRRADADLYGSPGVNQTFLDGMEKRRAVAETLAEAIGPRIDMRIEMDKCQLAGPLRQCPQQGKGNRMVAAERNEMIDRACLCLDRRQRALDIAMHDPEIADIGNFGFGRGATGDRVIAIDQHAAGLPDRGRTEARTRTIRGTEIVGNAGDADRCAGIAALETKKTRASRKSRYGCHVFSMLRLRTAAALRRRKPLR